MKLKIEIKGSFEEIMKEHIEDGERAVKKSLVQAGQTLKQAWRDQIKSAGLGRRLGNTIRSAAYPIGQNSFNAAAFVWSNAPNIVAAMDQGALIRSRNGVALAVPLPEAGHSRRGGRLTPEEWERQRGLKLRFVPRGKGKLPLLVADDARLNKKGLARKKGGRRRKKDGILSGAQTVPIFVLVPQVRLRKVLDLQRATRQVHNSLPGLIVSNWVEK